MKSINVLCIFLFFGVSSVISFSWQNCGHSSDPVKVMFLDVVTENTQLLRVSGKVKVAENLTSPIQGKLDIWKKFFWGWTVIPCVDKFGSCSYDNLCELTPYLNGDCPAEFISNHLPCKCPIIQGQYKVKNLPIDLQSILPDWIEKGTYKLKLSITKDSKEVLCLLLIQEI